MKNLYLIAIICSLNSSAQVHLLDQWLRVDDRIQNPHDPEMPTQDSTIIEVMEKKDDIIGILIRIPKTSISYGYSVGQIKWKNFKEIGKDIFEADGLLMESGASGNYDVPVYLKMQLRLTDNRNTILLSTPNQGDRFNWSKQKWIRLPKV